MEVEVSKSKGSGVMRPVFVFGVEYRSLSAACEALGVSYGAVKRRLLRGIKPEDAFEQGRVMYKAKERHKQDTERGVRTCKSCGEEKPLDSYPRHSSCYGGVSRTCRGCKTNKSRERRYGVNAADYDKMFQRQGGKCAICGTTNPATHQSKGGKSSFCVDHCHETGKVRGLLCGYCNTGIGKLRDDPDILRKAAQYIEENK